MMIIQQQKMHEIETSGHGDGSENLKIKLLSLSLLSLIIYHIFE